MKVLVCDDEPLARERLVRLLTELGVDTIAEADSGATAIESVYQFQPDLLLLDIEMPVMNGLEVARQLLESSAEEGALPAILFCTAYDSYALDAFRANAADYLLKPVRKETLSAALDRSRRLNRAQYERVKAAERVSSEQLDDRVGEEQGGRYINVRTAKGIERIAVEEIRYFKADQKYVLLRTVSNELLVDETLKELELKFSEEFVRVHRNALVAVRHIELLEQNSGGQWTLKMFGVSEHLQVSRRHRAALKKRIQRLH